MRINEATKQGYVDIPMGGCVDLSQLNSKTRRGRKMENKSNCLTTQMSFYEYVLPIPIKVSKQGGEIIPNESGKSVCVMTRGNVGWTNQNMNGVAEQVDDNNIKNMRNGAKIYSIKDGEVTIIRNNGSEEKKNLYRIELPDGDYLIRKLYPIEAERLQTLPDNYTEGISDTQRYKCIGNGWTVDVIAHIFKGLAEQLKGESK